MQADCSASSSSVKSAGISRDMIATLRPEAAAEKAH